MAFDLMESRRRILMNTPHIEAVSGDIAAFSTDMAAPLKSCVVTINLVQTGTGDPSPDNVRPISGWSAVNLFRESAYDPDADPYIPITLPAEAGTVYGGKLDLRAGVLTVTWTCHTFDGVNRKASSLAQVSATSDFTYVRGLYNVILDDLPNDFPYNNSGNRLSSHFLWWTYSARRNVKPDNICFTTSGRVVRWYSSTYTTLQEFNDYLADQYALGTPVQLVYQLPTPVTYQLTPQQLSTLKGSNNIWGDCGPVSIKYWKH